MLDLSDVKDGVCLHASSVNVLGKSIIFLGRSTSGKSTISKILEKEYPIIADDIVWVFPSEKGKWMVRDATYGFIGDQFDVNRFGKESFPLFAIIRIFKSDRDQISLIAQKETCKYLLDAIFEIDLQRKVSSINQRKKWFKIAVKIAKNTKGWLLTFKKSNNIIEQIKML